MNEQEFKNRIEERFGGDPKMRSRGRLFTGLLLFFIGILWLLRAGSWVWFPNWFFSWPMLIIAIGLLSGIKEGFRGGFWLIMLIVGGVWLYSDILHVDIHSYIWPIVFIALGLMFILRPRGHRHHWRRYQRYHYDARCQPQPAGTTGSSTAAENIGTMTGDYDRRDFIDITAVFGGVKKNVLSKNFKGGDITSFMGGSEIDLSQADFSGRITIDVTNVFGGTKLIVPPTWDVQNDITAIFGGVDDKRQISGVAMDPNKVLVLDGTCMFGGIEIRSF